MEFDLQSNITDPFAITERRPPPLFYTFLVRYYGKIVRSIISIIILLAVLPFNLWLAVLALILYFAYQVIKPITGRQYRFVLGPFGLKEIDPLTAQIMRVITLIIGVSLFLAWAYSLPAYSHYLQIVGTDTLWLLNLIPLISITQRVTLRIAALLCALAIISLILVRALTTSTYDISFWHSVSLQALWIALLTIIVSVMVRLRAHRAVRFQLLHYIAKVVHLKLDSMRRHGEVADLVEIFDVVSSSLRRDFGYSHVTVFIREPDNTLRCIASSGKQGDRLMKMKYALPSGRGIVRHVFELGRGYLSNDVASYEGTPRPDPHYLYNENFHDTKSELAVPVMVDGIPFAVIDLQDSRRQAFIALDREVMLILADYLGSLLTNVSNMEAQESLGNIVETLASSVLSQNELRSLLKTVTDAACVKLGADFVTLLEYNAATGVISPGPCSGVLNYPDLIEASLTRATKRIHLFKVEERDLFIHEDVNSSDVLGDPLFAYSDDVDERGYQPLPIREGVKSRVAVSLRANGEFVGLMYLNYRLSTHLDTYGLRAIRTFAHLAALAIYKAHTQQEQVLEERERLRWALHQTIKGAISSISDQNLALARRLERSCYDQATRNMVFDLQEDIRRLSRSIEFIDRTEASTASVDFGLVNSIQKIFNWAVKTYEPVGITVTLDWEVSSVNIPELIVREVIDVLREILLNAVHHATPTYIKAHFVLFGQDIVGTVENDGKSPSSLGYGDHGTGILGITKRLDHIGGSFYLEDGPNGIGAIAHLCFPSFSQTAN